MKSRITALFVAASIVALLVPSSAASAADNAWLERRVLNIAHQGGEIEAPSNTMFAFKTALQKGAEVLELDVHVSKDGELVVLHDATVDRTTNGTGAVDEMTLEEIKKLDAAYWFVPGCGTCNDSPEEAFAYRGYATGDRKIHGKLRKTYTPDDFEIPTLREVLTTFPTTLINIEIKATAPDTTPYEDKLAALLAEFGRTDDTMSCRSSTTRSRCSRRLDRTSTPGRARDRPVCSGHRVRAPLRERPARDTRLCRSLSCSTG
ncbi:MAG TPA: glycerophosphodiester phosphodiesterase family protein [Actinomycetota bacterium]